MLKKILSLMLATITILTMFSAVSFTASAETVTVAYIEGDNVNVRTGPSFENSIIERISYTSATVIETVSDGTWLKISYYNDSGQIIGYIYNDSSYIRVVTYDPDASFEEKFLAFPESYRNALRGLKAAYKNWEFIPDPVDISFAEAVDMEANITYKQVNFSSQPVSWRSMGQGSYDWNEEVWVQANGGWTGASREITAYYMDPRNFLNTTEIFQFLQQGYDAAYQTEEGVKKIIAGTFMENNYTDPNDTAYGGSYAKVIMAAAAESGVSPYIIATKIRLEIGTTVSNMVSGTYSGYEGYYNFFNIGASGSTETAVIQNGLARAKTEGWNTRSKAIIGGAKFLSNNYISRGQDTYYYQDFNVHNPDELWHQYAQAVHDACSKGKLISSTYNDEYDFALTFKIPVYTSMPESVSAKPVSNSKKNNYYFTDIKASGLTPSFSMFTYNYDLLVNGDTKIAVFLPSTASYVSAKTFNLTAGNNLINLEVKSETGYINTYTVNVLSENICNLNIVVNECANHSFTLESNKYLKSNANCTSPAIYYYECAVCGDVGENTYTYGEALGHNFSSDWTVDKEATYYEKGVKSRHCSRCDEVTDKISIPKISIANGSCGENALWALYLDGTLELSGSGEAYGYGTAEEVPWYEYADEISRVEIAEEITYIGHYSFNCLENLKEAIVYNPDLSFSPYYVFNKNTETVIYGISGSAVEDYAIENNIAFVPLNAVIPVAPIIESVNGNTVTLVYIAGYEYSKDGEIWQTDNVFTNISYDTVQYFYQRIAENDTSTASPSSVAVKCIIVSAPKVLVGATTLKIIPIDGYKYSINGIKYQTENLFAELVPEWNYTVYQEPVNADGIYVYSENNSITVCTNGTDKITEPNSTHLVWLRKLLLENNCNNLAADFNQDGEIDLRDLVSLKKQSAGI